MIGDASEIRALAHDVSAVSAKMVAPMREVFDQAGEAVADEWRDIATVSSGVHGKWYPKSIDHELKFSTNIVVEIGPNTAKKQGSMGRGFEFGSINQSPHLDGVKAMDKMEPRVERIIDATIGHLLP